ncbi:hypothetical protein NC652_028624 [Populus alba x Populus x berolinensis]|uniref:Uncharacterized protein n=1 Tax=Populus alba x Populus x berolinensis TaxID=444605 RepID=A0AAD6Q5C0_9ROSI|nr:hypothetical protein NC651_027740 [Populus alba x Populus x berolinensis]KAJ6894942.1 hypothetical protein NC652_028624 [Populus alba x Populus x berolinensis]KAJ6978440.1 hypothetical protein NC653_026749 [Populus alba x Populus x berolinensis]
MNNRTSPPSHFSNNKERHRPSQEKYITGKERKGERQSVRAAAAYNSLLLNSTAAFLIVKGIQ